MTWSSDPVHDADLYAIERGGNVVGHCASCGGEIYGRSRNFDSETYILDDDGNMIHPTMKCLWDVLGEQLFDWMLEDYGKKEIIDVMLDSMRNPLKWLLENCEQRGWVNG